jgi:hypothetical protein
LAFVCFLDCLPFKICDSLCLLAEERAKVLAQARVGHVLESQVATKLKEAEERESATEKAAK